MLTRLQIVRRGEQGRRMDPQAAGSLIRYILATDIENKSIKAGDSWLRRKFTGMNAKALQKKRMVLSSEQRGIMPASDGWPETFVCFWMMSSREDDDKGSNLVFEQVKGAFLTIATVGVGAGIQGLGSTTVAQVHSAYDFAGSVSSVPNTRNWGGRAYAQMDAVVQDCAYHAAKGTDLEWCMASRSAMLYGCAAISLQGEIAQVFLRRCRDMNHLESLMRASYRRGINTVDGKRCVRDYSDDEHWALDFSTGELLRGNAPYRVAA